MSSGPRKLIIVRRGKLGTFELLTRWMKHIPDAHIIWDRRCGEDRRHDKGGASIECRAKERRRPQAAHGNVLIPSAADAWSVYWYIATQVSRRQPSAPAPSVG